MSPIVKSLIASLALFLSIVSFNQHHQVQAIETLNRQGLTVSFSLLHCNEYQLSSGKLSFLLKEKEKTNAGSSLLLLLLLLLQRETIIENHEKRREKLEELLKETVEKVTEHENGRNLMEQEEYETMTKRIGLYEKKLERMKEPLDERDINRMIEREVRRAERYNRVEL